MSSEELYRTIAYLVLRCLSLRKLGRILLPLGLGLGRGGDPLEVLNLGLEQFHSLPQTREYNQLASKTGAAYLCVHDGKILLQGRSRVWDAFDEELVNQRTEFTA